MVIIYAFSLRMMSIVPCRYLGDCLCFFSQNDVNSPPPLPALGKRPSLRDVLGSRDPRTLQGNRALPPTPDEATSRWFSAGDWEGEQKKGTTALSSVQIQQLKAKRCKRVLNGIVWRSALYV